MLPIIYLCSSIFTSTICQLLQKKKKLSFAASEGVLCHIVALTVVIVLKIDLNFNLTVNINFGKVSLNTNHGTFFYGINWIENCCWVSSVPN